VNVPRPRLRLGSAGPSCARFHVGTRFGSLDGLAADCELFATRAGSALAPNPWRLRLRSAVRIGGRRSPIRGAARDDSAVAELGSLLGRRIRLFRRRTDFDLAAAPAQPVPQKFPFEPGISFPGGIPRERCRLVRREPTGGEFFKSGADVPADAAATAEQFRLEPLGSGERDFYRPR